MKLDFSSVYTRVFFFFSFFVTIFLFKPQSTSSSVPPPRPSNILTLSFRVSLPPPCGTRHPWYSSPPPRHGAFSAGTDCVLGVEVISLFISSRVWRWMSVPAGPVPVFEHHPRSSQLFFPPPLSETRWRWAAARLGARWSSSAACSWWAIVVFFLSSSSFDSHDDAT